CQSRNFGLGEDIKGKGAARRKVSEVVGIDIAEFAAKFHGVLAHHFRERVPILICPRLAPLTIRIAQRLAAKPSAAVVLTGSGEKRQAEIGAPSHLVDVSEAVEQ